MATEAALSAVNGNYAPHHSYAVDQAAHQNNGHYANHQTYSQAPPTAAAASHTTNATHNGNQNAEIPKDEVGWFFVEQYYTTLSKTPDRLFLYYNKRSQFVSGNETDKVQVCLGQRAISDRMKELDFQDCKVRITNVDSQASDQNIVIQVIGEISNKSQPHRKFTQTFVLATQTNGYFVLNDIFRYLIEEEEEEAEAQGGSQTQTGAQVDAAQSTVGSSTPHPAISNSTEDVASAQPKTLTSSTDPSAIEQDAKHVDKTIEKKLLSNGVDANTPVPAAQDSTPAIPKAETSETPERPTEPEPTPAASPPKQAPAQPAAISSSTPKPVTPKTWASLAASANKSGAVGKPAASATQAQTSAPRLVPTKPAAANNASAPSAPAASSASVSAVAAQDDTVANDSQDEWTAVGSNHNRQQSRQVNGQQSQQQSVQQQEGPQRRGFIKNVHDHVTIAELQEKLEKVAKIVNCDISRAKNCAFIEFETPEGYQAAVAANPHTVGADQFYVEERKVRAGGTPFVPRGQFQGGRGGRGDFRGGRGNAQQRGRGQGGVRGGRGGAQQT